MPYRWMDLEEDEEAETLLASLGVETSETPVVIGGQVVLLNPSNGQVAEMLGTRFARRATGDGAIW